ncbi:MAG: ATP-binding protein [Bacteroidota bacterium]|nr:ATP-binding protein [Bacteroidota bacterium]
MNVFDLILTDKEQIDINDIFLKKESKEAIHQLIKEHKYIQQLNQYGLPVSNKVILYGDSGCGKTMTAKAIAQALGKEIIIVNLSNIINSRIGETSQNIKQLFDKAKREKAVLFLDEFDQIGKARIYDDNDVGEMKRLVNSVIQLIDYLPIDSLLIVATNHINIIDSALIRRFQIRVEYLLPNNDTLDAYYNRIASSFPENLCTIERKYNISFAEAKDHMLTLIKNNLIQKLEENNL